MPPLHDEDCHTVTLNGEEWVASSGEMEGYTSYVKYYQLLPAMYKLPLGLLIVR